jgi:hydrogenase expression/formation protein HypE
MIMNIFHRERYPMDKDYIELDHGSGGEATSKLIRDIFLSRLDNKYLRTLDDSAVFDFHGSRLAMTTDSYVVQPIFFPGGDIGSLSIHGTVNDLSMQGADPIYLTLGMIIEEGFPVDDLKRIVDSISKASREASVKVIAGDTKVVPRGQADGIFINTAGLGILRNGIDVSCSNAKPGDVVIINGPIGDHGMAILAKREGLEFELPLLSDSAPLNSLVSDILSESNRVHVLRDPTSGGLATALNEIARSSGVGIKVDEASVPINRAVLSACELLGLDPFYVANEGKCIVVVDPRDAERVLGAMRKNPRGNGSCVIGEVIEDNPGRVLVTTMVGGTRILSMLTGEQLPRIC